jgi:hypothetical protein
MESFNHCLKFFREYRSQSVSAQRCRKVLEVLQEQIIKYRRGKNPLVVSQKKFPAYADVQAGVHKTSSSGNTGLFSNTVPSGSAPPTLLFGETNQEEFLLSHDPFLETFSFDNLSALMLDSDFDSMWLPELTF